MAQVKNNPVTQLLVTSGNAAVLAAGNQPSALAVGQLGFFNYADHISIDGTNAGKAAKFYIAVGIDPQSTGALADVMKSAGQYIQRDNVAQILARCYSPARVQIVDITDFTVKCDTDYVIRINVNSAAARANFGANTPWKVYSTWSGCCTDDCATCPKGDCNGVAKGLVDNINADPEQLFTADFLDYTTTPGTPVVVPYGDYQTWVDAAVLADPDNPACLGIRLTGKAEPKQTYNGINRKYDALRGVHMQVSFAAGFDCTGKITYTQDLIYEQGAGYDLAHEEWMNGGYNGDGNYVLSEVLGMPINDNVPTFVNKSGQYLTVTIENNLNSAVGSWSEYDNPEQTRIAIPCADTATRTSVGAFLNAIFAGKFDSLVDDLAACPACNVPNLTSGLTDATDGIA